ncbi:uncharacterized protein LOC124168966 isoform X2 [Ischnura elegans]|uniref:uncharacterized protein LOC124168966 isoform X2 n=1 Tax=Ischnura elegans TaxID=197161 RepID=UPI001ED88DA2|nr:uncharacterized protein LOC124168966 isoform X2 [Ischnura elegans]
MDVNTDGVDFIGIWKVIGCVVLGKNSDVTNCNGASLVLRPDGSFSWFGPRTGDILELNKFCAYKIIGKPMSNPAAVCGTNVSHPSISILFESGRESIHNQPLCCEVTVNFGNTMVLQFPGQCLMHFSRLSKDFRSDTAQAMDFAENIELGPYSLPFKEKTGCSETKSSAQNSANVPCDIKHKASVSSANTPGLCLKVAERKSEAKLESYHSDECPETLENQPSFSANIKPKDVSRCDSIPNATALEIPPLHGSTVHGLPNTGPHSVSVPGASSSKKVAKEGISHKCGDMSDHSVVSSPQSCPSSSLAPTPPVPPPPPPPYPHASCSIRSPPHLSPNPFQSSQFECIPTNSQDLCDGTSQSEVRRNAFQNFSSIADKSHDMSKDADKSRSSLEDPETPSTSSSSSTSSMAMSSSSHKCQDSAFSLLRALQEGYFSDLVLVAENGVKFEVHSTILGLSFPNIDWAAAAEEDGLRSPLNNCERKCESSECSSVNSLKETVSNTCKCPSNREVGSQARKTKTCSSSQNSHHTERKCPKIQNSVLSSGHEKDKGWKESFSSQKRYSSENSFPPTKVKQREDSSKVKLPILPEDVLGALLHYAYSESLPPSLSPDTAEQCLKLLSPPSPLAVDTVAFRNMCTSYLRNNALRQDIVTLTAGIHGCLSKMEEHLTMGDYFGMVSSEEDEEEDDIGRRADGTVAHRRRDKGLPHPTPSRLCSALKQAAREASLAMVLALELCQVYAKNQCHLGKREVREVAQFAASRLAPLASQLDAVLSAVLRSIPPAISPVVAGARHSPPLNDNQRRNGHDHHHQLPHGDGSTLRDRLASHLVPEMESALEVLSTLTMCLKEDIEEILVAMKSKGASKEERKSSPSSASENDDSQVQLDDEGMLNCIHQRIAFYLFHLMQKKESFSDLGNGGRFRVICQTLEQLSEELPIFLLRLRDALATIDEQLAPEHLSQPLAEWTSKVNSLLNLLSTHRSILQPLLLMISELVQREAFLVSLQRLKLLNCSSDEDDACRVDSPTKGPPPPSTFPPECDASSYKLSLVGSLITPPPARRSHLCRRALKLLRTGNKADMVFQVALTSISSSDVNNPPIADTRLGFLEWDEDSDAVNGGRWVWRIGAHRAIVAARCDWFRRALLSGMKEAIKRQIVVHDTTPQQLLLFLQWIYGGQLKLEWNIYQDGNMVPDGRKECGQYPHGVLGAEQLWALLVLADQLEVDDLKNACEHMLLSGGCHLADPEATLACLSLADQVNARAMRSACLQHISCNPTDVVESELFEELPSSLQSEVYDRLIWSRPRKSQTTEWLLSTPEEEDDDADCERKSGLSFTNPLHEHTPHGESAAIGESSRGREGSSRE